MINENLLNILSYHLDNYKRNNAYCLPQSLRPTLVQRSVQLTHVWRKAYRPKIIELFHMVRCAVYTQELLSDIILESVIDSIPHPELRDRLILLRSQLGLRFFRANPLIVL